MYIGDLGEDATRRELEEAFNKFGRVRNVWIAKRPPGGLIILLCDQDSLTGFAFVLMDDPRDAEDATRELDGSRMCGRRFKVSFCLLLFFPLNKQVRLCRSLPKIRVLFKPL